jgi:gamma-tubulin complex component 3
VNTQRDGMATFNKERVEHALNELLVRIIPDDPDEDEATANQRFEVAFDFAIDELENAPNLTIVPDINHVASSIDEWSRHLDGF